MTTFILGLIIGFWLGFMMAAVCAVASRADDDMGI